MEERLSEKRQRLKRLMFENGIDSFSDSELLEYYLCLTTAGSNSKKACDNLFSTFGDLETIVKTEPRMLRTIDGVTDVLSASTALIHTLMCMMSEEKNNEIKCLKDISLRKEYVYNILRYETVEHIVLIKLKKNMRIAGYETISKGGVNFSLVSPLQFARVFSIDKPEYAIVAHNHPQGGCIPSTRDISFTNKLSELAADFNCTLIDHIIIGDDTKFSFAENGLIRKNKIVD